MSAILEQLGLDQTFFIQFGIFAVLFFVLARVYFRPFYQLIETRHRRTIQDREAAEKLMAQADAKFEEYRKKLAEERILAHKAYEDAITEARKEETAILSRARDEAKKITHEAAESINQQRAQVKAQLEADIEGMAQSISEKLLSRKA